MHEYFVVKSVLQVVEDIINKYPGKKIIKAVLLIGKFSGVEPELLKTALEFFKKGTPLEEAEIVIEIEDFKVRCKTCAREFSKDRWDLSCPYCESFNTEIVSGEELLLKSLELVDAS